MCGQYKSSVLEVSFYVNSSGPFILYRKLSVMNMGGNILEVIFLLASACIANIGISVCFIVSAVLIIILSAIVFLLSRSFYQDESENS